MKKICGIRFFIYTYICACLFIGNADSYAPYGINPGGIITNTAMGVSAMTGTVTGTQNTALGQGIMINTISGSSNTGVGVAALQTLTSSPSNTAVGAFAGANVTTGGTGGNTLIGLDAGETINSGSANLVLSANAAGSTVLTTGTNNILLGTNSTCAFTSSSQANTITVCAGSTGVWSVTGAGTPSTAAQSFTGSVAFPNVTTGTNTDFVCMASGNVLTLQTTACTISSQRFKENLIDMRSNALPMIGALEVASFNMKQAATQNPDPNYGSRQIGLIAENVAKIAPECAIYENDMKTPKSYRQECVIALLVKSVQEQQKEIDILRATHGQRPNRH